VFLLNSRNPLVCAPPFWLPRMMACFSRSYAGNLPSSFSTLRSSALVFSTSPPVSVSGTVYVGAISRDTSAAEWNPITFDNVRHPSLTHWPTNIHVVPIDYGFRPRLRGRLTLRRLTLRRNPWTFGGSGSHTALVTHVSIRTSNTSRRPHGSPFTGLWNAPLQRAQLLRGRHTRSFGTWL
jgi:hypothetical protein